MKNSLPYCNPEIKYLSDKRYASSYQRSFAFYTGRTIIGHPIKLKNILGFARHLHKKEDKLYITNYRNYSFPDQLYGNISIYLDNDRSASRNFTLVKQHNLNKLLKDLPKDYVITQRFIRKPWKHEVIIQRVKNKP